MTLDMANDYVIDPDINALTDWVLTMPTKQAYTAPVLRRVGNPYACARAVHQPLGRWWCL
jgi:hypothetical protein